VELGRFVAQEMEANGGKLYITKDSGVFEADGIRRLEFDAGGGVS
jgi:hypothetical protein